MAARNLVAAAEAAARHPDHRPRARRRRSRRRRPGATPPPTSTSRTTRSSASTRSRRATPGTQVWDFEAYKDRYPLLLSAPYFDLYRKQVVKQADLVLAMHWCGDEFSPEDKARNVDYYERRTVRDSSLSACTQAVMAAEVGHLELAHDYAYEAALIDLRDLHHNSRDGLHMASLAGAWIALVAGFGGLRDHGGELWFDPGAAGRHLPAELLDPVARRRGCGSTSTTVGDVLAARRREALRSTFRHDGEDIVVTADKPVIRPLNKRTPMLPRPPQPLGREPRAAMASNERDL